MKSTVIIINQNGIGNGPTELTSLLVKNYLDLLTHEKKLPAVVLFYGEGVKLLCSGSEVIGSLLMLEKHGVKLIACKTCLNYFGLSESVKAGKMGSMSDILTLQMEADKVITL